MIIGWNGKFILQKLVGRLASSLQRNTKHRIDCWVLVSPPLRRLLDELSENGEGHLRSNKLDDKRMRRQKDEKDKTTEGQNEENTE